MGLTNSVSLIIIERGVILVPYQGDIYGYRAPQTHQIKALSAGNGKRANDNVELAGLWGLPGDQPISGHHGDGAPGVALP